MNNGKNNLFENVRNLLPAGFRKMFSFRSSKEIPRRSNEQFQTVKERTFGELRSIKEWSDDLGVSTYIQYHCSLVNCCGKCSHLDETFEPLEKALKLNTVPFDSCNNRANGCTIAVQGISEGKYLSIVNAESASSS